MAEPRIDPFDGANEENDVICVQISGDVLNKIHRFSSSLTAIED